MSVTDPDEARNDIAVLVVWADSDSAIPKQWSVDAGRRLSAVVDDFQAARALAERYAALVKAAEHVEDILGFYEGSEEVIDEGGLPAIRLNAQGPEGDFQTMLAMTRDALAKLKGDRK